MAEKEGWIKLYRAIQDNWLWKDKPFSKGQAWMDLLMECNHKANKIVINNQIISIQKGQKLWSIKEMSDRWGWSRKKVSNFLNLLQTEGMLQQKRTSKYTLLTIVNYDLYQDGEHQKNIRGTSKEHQKNTNKNEKNEKNDKEVYSAFFEEIWSLYPSKKGKGQISDSKKEKLYKLGDEIKRCIKRYKAYVKRKRETDFPTLKYQNGSTFFTSGYIDYLDKNYNYQEEENGRKYPDSGNSGEVDYDEFSL